MSDKFSDKRRKSDGFIFWEIPGKNQHSRVLSCAVVFHAFEGSYDDFSLPNVALQKNHRCDADSSPATSNIDIHLKLSRGKELLDSLMEESQHNKCMREAINQLTKGCSHSTDHEFSKFAVQLANCHLSKSGLHTKPCLENMSIKECTGDMPAVHFQTYTMFYTHTETICYYIQNEVLQQRTTRTVRALYASAQDAAFILNELGDKSNIMASQVNRALESQNDLLTKSDSLQKTVSHLREEHTKHAIEANKEFEKLEFQTIEIGESLNHSLDLENELLHLQAEHGEALYHMLANHTHAVKSAQNALNDILEKFEEIRSINDALIGEFHGVRSIGFYVIACMMAYLLTSSTRTASVRPILLLLIPCSFVLEYYFQQRDVTDTVAQVSVRWSLTVLSIILVLYTFMSYRDYSQLTYTSMKALMAEDRLRFKEEKVHRDNILNQLDSIRFLASDILSMKGGDESSETKSLDQNGKPIRRAKRKSRM